MYGLLRGEGLARYYELRQGPGIPVADLHAEHRDWKWIESLEARVAGGADGCRIALDVQGIHCSACVWLMEELFRREDGGLGIVVNPALGSVELAVNSRFPLRRFVEDVERFGYLFGPPLKSPARRSNDLLVRAGICLALAGNAMLFASALYLGLREGPLYTLLSQLGWAAALLSVVIGGPVFFRSAWQGVRRGILHLDLPIAIGILLAFGGSTWSFFFAEGRAAYVDTVAAFIALMLLGRFLQERMVEANRNRLLASSGADGLFARRLEEGKVTLVCCPELEAEDVLLIAPTDLVPVDSVLIDGPGSFSLDWINGESEPRTYAIGEIVPSGSFNAGSRALRMQATQPFGESTVHRLLQNPRERDARALSASPWWHRVSKTYVILVLLAGALGFIFWMTRTGDLVRSLEVTTAVLVITCPCAFGIATPLAYELAQAGLRRLGLFVRKEGFLDRLRQVRTIVFDKTGTLTTGALELVHPEALEALAPEDRAALYDLVSRSAHPKSMAVARALSPYAVRVRDAIEVIEHPGRGLEGRIGAKTYRFGAPSWAADDSVESADCDLVFAVDGRRITALATRERMRGDAAFEAQKLVENGYELWILSGDSPKRAEAMAESLGLSRERGIGGKSPDAKAAWLDAHDASEALFIGDGINDSRAVEHALCSGTPAVDRPFMASRCDFFFVTPGLAPIGQALRISSALAQTVRRGLGFAILYNVTAVGLAWAGLMQPWLAAILMPASSLTSLAMTALSLSSRSSVWKS